MRIAPSYTSGVQKFFSLPTKPPQRIYVVKKKSDDPKDAPRLVRPKMGIFRYAEPSALYFGVLAGSTAFITSPAVFVAFAVGLYMAGELLIAGLHHCQEKENV